MPAPAKAVVAGLVANARAACGTPAPLRALPAAHQASSQPVLVPREVRLDAAAGLWQGGAKAAAPAPATYIAYVTPVPTAGGLAGPLWLAGS